MSYMVKTSTQHAANWLRLSYHAPSRHCRKSAFGWLRHTNRCWSVSLSYTLMQQRHSWSTIVGDIEPLYCLNRYHRTYSTHHQAIYHPMPDHDDSALQISSAKRSSLQMHAQKLTPFTLHAKENPHPSPEHLQHFHREYTTLQIIEVIQVRAELQAPGTP